MTSDPRASCCKPDPPRCLVVMYHYVRGEDDSSSADSSNPADLAHRELPGVRGLSIAAFRAQLDELCGALEPVDWARVQAALAGRGQVPDRSFLLTFDDGLVEHGEVVAECLARRNLRGVFFVTTGAIRNRMLLPAHCLHLVLGSMSDADLLIELQRAPVFGRIFQDWTDAHERESKTLYHYESPLRAKIKYAVMALAPPIERNAVLNDILRRHVGDPHEWAGRWYLRESMLRTLQAAGHTIGGHGHTHEALTRLDDGELRAELQTCGRVLAEMVGESPRPFSYPYGRFDERVAQACGDAGFCAGFTTQSRWATATDSPFAVPRIDTIHVSASLTRE